jgi:hypothetical protein
MWPLWALKAAGIFKRIPWHVWAGLALLAVWYWERDRNADAREAEVRAEMQVIIDRKEAARQAAVAESLRLAALNAEATRKADNDVTENLAREGAGADAFIAAGGVRKCPAARADAAPADQGAAVDAGAGSVPVMDDLPEVVTVLPEDVRICTENTVKARAWRDWGLAIEANSGVKP